MRRWQRRDHVGAGEQQGVRRRLEAQRALESILVWAKVGRRWKPQFERQWLEIAIGNPPAKGENCHKVKLEALPGHGLAAAEQFQDYPVSFVVLRNDDAGRVADYANITIQALQDAEEVRRRHHGISNHVEACRPGDIRIREPDRRVALSASPRVATSG